MGAVNFWELLILNAPYSVSLSDKCCFSIVPISNGYFLHFYCHRSMAEPTPACKKPRHSLLPDIETMEVQRSADKQSICAVKSGYEQMKAISLELTSVKRREKMNDECCG